MTRHLQQLTQLSCKFIDRLELKMAAKSFNKKK